MTVTAQAATAPRPSYDAARRGAWAVVGLTAGWACVALGSPWLLLGWLVPDLGVLAGGLHVVDDRGRLTRRAAIGYNTTHTLAGPVVLAVVAAGTSSSGVWAVAALWLCHIGVDRALGYTLKPVSPHA